jgi:hypothetical protein
MVAVRKDYVAPMGLKILTKRFYKDSAPTELMQPPDAAADVD